MAAETLHVIHVEDNEHDSQAFLRVLQKCEIHFEVTHFQKAEEALKELNGHTSSYNLIVSDHSLPTMSGLDFCKEILARDIQLPLVLLTGVGSESLAVEALKLGVDDYLVKDFDQVYLELLPLVLQEVVKRHQDVLACRRAERDKERLIVELQESLAQVKVLRGIVPICSFCKKIRDDKGYWNQVEEYIQKHSEAQFSHGLCPDCLTRELAKVEE